MTAPRWPVVAGIPLRAETPDGLETSHWLMEGWRDAPATREPIDIRYEIGSTEPGNLKLVLDGEEAVGRYYTDQLGNLAVHASASPDAAPQLLLTRSAGYAYTVRYASAGQLGPLQWRWPRTILTDALPARGCGAMVHASAVRLPGGAGVLCPGISGAGKSTFARCITAGDSSAVALSDDRVAMTDGVDGLRIWGTPWYSGAQLATGIDAPLTALVFPARGESIPRVTPMAPIEASRRFFRSLGVPVWSPERTAYVLEFADRIIASTPAFELAYAPEPGAGVRLRAVLEELTSGTAHAC